MHQVHEPPAESGSAPRRSSCNDNQSFSALFEGDPCSSDKVVEVHQKCIDPALEFQEAVLFPLFKRVQRALASQSLSSAPSGLRIVLLKAATVWSTSSTRILRSITNGADLKAAMNSGGKVTLGQCEVIVKIQYSSSVSIFDFQS